MKGSNEFTAAASLGLAQEIDYQRILDEIEQEVSVDLDHGKVADYIPALAEVLPNQWGMALRTVDGRVLQAGAAAESFSIQSISKVFALTLALKFRGDAVWERVGREPSGNSFDSLVQLEYERGVPRNPLINAGALVVTDIILSHTQSAVDGVLGFVRKLCGSETITVDPKVAQSERDWGNRNASLAYFLKSAGNLENSVDAVLDAYCHQCALAMSCLELAEAFRFLAQSGVDPRTGDQLMTASQCKRINALLLTCGVYDSVGDHAYRVGLPGKSGVGGGIVAIMPAHYCVSVWSPGLDVSGNSVAGTLSLELLTTKTGLSIF